MRSFWSCRTIAPYSLVEVIRPGGKNVAVIRLVECSGGRAVLKDYSGSSWSFRVTAGRYMAGREKAAYRRLEGVSGVPHLIGSLGRDGLLLEYIENAEQLQVLGEGTMKLEVFDQLRKILQGIRKRGVLHGDVKRNVHMDLANQCYLLDFGASFVVPMWLLPISSYLMELGRVYDERAVLDLKDRLAPESLTPTEVKLRDQRLPYQRLVGATQKVLHLLIRWLFN